MTIKPHNSHFIGARPLGGVLGGVRGQLLTGLIMLLMSVTLTLSTTAQAAQTVPSWCRVAKSPRVSIATDTDKINWVFNLPQSKLNGFDIDTVNPYGNSIHTDVGGLMKGGIGMTQTMKFNTLTHKGFNQSCVFYDNVTVNFKIEPSIFIASEYPEGSCKHNAIKAHEIKHINIDRQMVNKYAVLVGKAIKDEIDKRSIYGPVSVGEEDQVLQIMRSRMESILKLINSQMETERRTRQQAIDNLSEYERVNNLCR